MSTLHTNLHFSTGCKQAKTKRNNNQNLLKSCIGAAGCKLGSLPVGSSLPPNSSPYWGGHVIRLVNKRRRCRKEWNKSKQISLISANHTTPFFHSHSSPMWCQANPDGPLPIFRMSLKVVPLGPPVPPSRSNSSPLPVWSTRFFVLRLYSGDITWQISIVRLQGPACNLSCQKGGNIQRLARLQITRGDQCVSSALINC